MTTVLTVVLYLAGVPYLFLLAMTVVGMFLPPDARRTSDLPSVSVILPAHDEEERLPETLASLAEQEYAGPLEFVIVDDRSTDATRSVIEGFVSADARFRLVSVTEPSSKLAPKVNAVNHGIEHSTGEIIIATDADCEYHPGWVASLASHFVDGVTMVVGYVSTSRRGEARSLLQRFESVDWFTLMLVSRGLTRFGLKFASSANNLAYRRSAFESVGGFGAAGRAPSGDEDLLTQRLGRLAGGSVVFADEEPARVVTRGTTGAVQLLRQRRRWVSRYHHVLHYEPAFMTGIAILGLQSVLLTLSALLTPFVPGLLPWVLALWGAKALIEFVGMGVGSRQLDRPDLWGLSTLWWILLHPPFIAAAVVGSFLKPSSWYAGAESYRSRFLKRRWREWRRKLRVGVGSGD